MYALFIAENNLPISSVDSKSFDRLLSAFKGRGTRYHRNHIATVSIPKCERRMREFIISHLKGSNVCVVIDEMTKFGTTYCNFLLCARVEMSIDPEKNAVFFWDSRILDDSTSLTIGQAIGRIADELEAYGITVASFASDNCNSMKKAEDYALCSSGRKIRRVPCGSHALNNILKELLEMEPLKSIWGRVLLCCRC